VLRLARDVEAVGVDDRDDDGAGPLEQVRRACVRAEARQQVVGELDRVLAGRPLAGVVDPICRKIGLPSSAPAASVISMPLTSRPSIVRCGSVIGLTSEG
jgi:hypothetical protein